MFCNKRAGGGGRRVGNMVGYIPFSFQKNKKVVYPLFCASAMNISLLPRLFALYASVFSYFLLFGGNFPIFLVKIENLRVYYLFFR